MNAKSKRSSEKSLLQSTSHLVVQGNPLVRNFTAEMSVNQLKLFYYLIGTGGEQAHAAQACRVEGQIAKAPDMVQTSCCHK